MKQKTVKLHPQRDVTLSIWPSDKGAGKPCFLICPGGAYRNCDESAALRYARMCGLHLSHLLRVRTVERKQPKRFIATFVTAPCECRTQMLTIMEKGKYTDEYISLVKDFYLFG